MAECPECGFVFEVNEMEQGEIFTCKDCGIELELFSVNPVVVQLAPAEEEDWGE